MATHKQTFIPGLIAFAALVIFFGGILWLSGGGLLSSRNYRIYCDFEDVVGISDQSPVYMRGFRVGSTEEVDFLETTVRVGLDIGRKFRIPVDSRAEITTLNLIGEKAITIVPGESTEALPPDAVIEGVNRDLMSMAAGVLESARARIEEGDLDAVVRKASESLDTMLALMQKMGRKVDKLDIDLYNRGAAEIARVAGELQVFARSAARDTADLARIGGEGVERFNRTLEEVDTALAQMTALSAEIRDVAAGIRRGEGTVGALVRDRQFFANLNRTLDELNAFLADIKKNPKKYVKFSIF